MEAIRRIMQLSTCLWGGFYNPIIPVSSTIPDVWKESHFPDPSGLRLARGYLDFFEPDVFVEAESGLAAQVGLADTEIDIGHSRVMPLDAFFGPHRDRDSRMPFGVNIFDLYKDLYEREFKFVPAALIEQLAAPHPRAPEGGNLPLNTTSGILAVFPQQSPLYRAPRHISDRATVLGFLRSIQRASIGTYGLDSSDLRLIVMPCALTVRS
jgi:hypothetical protein